MAASIPSELPSEYMVNDEVWETETYRQLFGKYSSPLSKPRYSNVGGVEKLWDGPNEQFPELEVPSGWEVPSGEWILWPGTSLLTRDRDGWLYGKSYGEIESQVQDGLDCGSDEVRKASSVRRRRWIRTRKCVSEEAREVVKAELLWLGSIVMRLKTSLRSKREDHIAMLTFEEQRKKAYKDTRTRCAHRVIAFKDVLLRYQENMSSLKLFMREREELDRDYSRRLMKLSAQYLAAGEKNGKNIAAELRGADTDAGDTGSSSSPAAVIEDGFFYIVNTAMTTAAEQLGSFSSELASTHWPEIDTLLDTIASLCRKCDVEALELWNSTRVMERSALAAFEEYTKGYGRSCQRGVVSIERIAKVLAQADETHVLETGSLSDLLSGGIYGGKLVDADGGGEKGPKPSLTLGEGDNDVYALVHSYRVLVSKSLRGHDAIQRFTDFVERDTRKLAANVASVLRRATEVFFGRQGSMFSDIGRELAFKGREIEQRAQTMFTVVADLGADIIDDAGSRRRQESVASSVASDETPVPLPLQAQILSPNPGIDQQSSQTDSPVPKDDGLDSSPPRRGASGSAAAPFNMKDLPPESNTVVASGIFMVASADDAASEARVGSDVGIDGGRGSGEGIWCPVQLLATADGYVHFFRESSSDSRLSVSSDDARGLFGGVKCPTEPVRSVQLARTSVRLAMLPGRDDALEIGVQQDMSASASMAAIMKTATTSSGPKDRWETATTLVVHADGTGLDSGRGSMRDWIRLLHNPLADPALAPPHLD